MRKSLLTTFVILLSISSAQAASVQGRMKTVVVRTNVQPIDIKVMQAESSQSITNTATKSPVYMIERIY